MFEVYVLTHNRRPIYVGQGLIGRSQAWMFPSRYKQLGLKQRPLIAGICIVQTRKDALVLESKIIKLLKPSANQFHNGIVVWNKGLRKDSRCRGGRPKGIPMSTDAKKKLSIAMRGKATRWLKGRHPWNYGLTKNTHKGLLKLSINMKGNLYGRRA